MSWRRKPLALVLLIVLSAFLIWLFMILIPAPTTPNASPTSLPGAAQGGDEDFQRAQLAYTDNDLKFLIELLTSYRDDVGAFPTTEQGLDALFKRPEDLPETAGWNGPYVNKPMSNDAWGNPYHYKKTGESVELYSFGPDGKPGTGDDIKGL